MPDEITPEMRAYWGNRLGPEQEQRIYDDVARLVPNTIVACDSCGLDVPVQPLDWHYPDGTATTLQLCAECRKKDQTT